MSTINIDNLTGVGLIFPLQINNIGTAQLSKGWDLLKSSLNNIVAFVVGERYFLGEFGVNPIDLLEEQNDDISKNILEHRLQEQIPVWDKRLNVDSVDITRPEENTINVVVNVSLNGTDIQETFVFPFLINSVA